MRQANEYKLIISFSKQLLAGHLTGLMDTAVYVSGIIEKSGILTLKENLKQPRDLNTSQTNHICLKHNQTKQPKLNLRTGVHQVLLMT